MFKLIENIIIISLEGKFNAGEAKALYADLQKALPKLKKGFTLLTDLSLLENIDPDVYDYVRKTMDLLNRHGVSKVVRIIPDPSKDRGFGIMSLFHYPQNIAVHMCKSFEEAYKFLG